MMKKNISPHLHNNSDYSLGKYLTKFHRSRRTTDVKAGEEKKEEKQKASSSSSPAAATSTTTKISKQILSRRNKAAKELDARKMKKKVIVFTVDAGFPNVTSNLPVTGVEETLLDPVQTAMETISEQEEFVASHLLNNNIAGVVVVDPAATTTSTSENQDTNDIIINLQQLLLFPRPF